MLKTKAKTTLKTSNLPCQPISLVRTFVAIETAAVQVAAPQNLKVALQSLMRTPLLQERAQQGQQATCHHLQNLPRHYQPSPGSRAKKKKIIIELSDPSSDIHLLLGRYTDKDFKSVSFKHILIVYAGNRFKMSNFRENMKRLLVHKLNQTGDFKEKTTEPWYTSVNKVSKAYSLLFMMYMESTMSQAVRSLSDEELWKSHPQFQLHELKKFETYNKNMQILTSKRTALISKEEDSYNADLLILSTRGEISRDVPLWNTHVASDMLKEHIEEEMSGAITKTKPQMLWKSMKEYQDFPLSIFRKHMYQERTKQLAAPFWQHKRNKIARTRFEETEAMLKEWSQAQLNMRVDAVAAKMEHINLDNNDV